MSNDKKYINYKYTTEEVEISDVLPLEGVNQTAFFDMIAEARVNGKTKLFHHFVIQSGIGKDRDHINRNKLDNRKCNLRVVSRTINNYNRENFNKYGVKGVYYKNGKFISRITYKNKQKYLGSFNTIEEAKIARENAELEILKKEGVV